MSSAEEDESREEVPVPWPLPLLLPARGRLWPLSLPAAVRLLPASIPASSAGMMAAAVALLCCTDRAWLARHAVKSITEAPRFVPAPLLSSALPDMPAVSVHW